MTEATMKETGGKNAPLLRILAAGASGALFGAGLVISGMSDPNKVLSFLALQPGWDPSLLVVMGAATITTFLGYRLVWRHHAPRLDQRFHVPRNNTIDFRLLGGAAIFGLGWGLVGYCPGPALTALAINPKEGLWFVGAMLLGMLVKQKFFRPAQAASSD